MTETKYSIRKATPLLPVGDLLEVSYENAVFDVSYPAFGPNTYIRNLTEMQKTYFHSLERPSISFREPTTSESILAAVCDFGNVVKPQILDPRWLQLGRIIKTPKGIYANPPKDEKGDVLIDEYVLNTFRDKAKKVNGIYLGDNGFGFAPYETFNQEVREFDEFVEGGLARLLEHTEGRAENLGKMFKFYSRGVNVFGFDKVDEPIVRVASLESYGGCDGDMLTVGGHYSSDDGDDGFAFGVSSGTGEASAKKILSAKKQIKNSELYSPRQISSALKLLKINGLEDQILKALRKD